MNIPEHLLNAIVCEDAISFLSRLPDNSIHCVVTSPPYYGLRDYKATGQIGLENSLQGYTGSIVTVFREIKRVLRNDGTVWLNLGDSHYNRRTGKGQAMVKQGFANSDQDLPTQNPRRNNDLGIPQKSLCGIPWRVALAMQDDGWTLRSDIIWHKPNPTPERVQDRPTKSHEYVFLFSKQERYHCDMKAIRVPKKNGRGSKNRTDVWKVAKASYKGKHFATFPPELIEPMILAGCPEDGIILDPFMGVGTTAIVARQLGRMFTGCDINCKYVAVANKRLEQIK